MNQESGEATVPINFTNKENVQNAENVRIVIEASKPFSLHDDKALRELKTIRSNGKGESILLHFMIQTPQMLRYLSFLFQLVINTKFLFLKKKW